MAYRRLNSAAASGWALPRRRQARRVTVRAIGKIGRGVSEESVV